jgi:hypothetical protein
LVRAYHVNHVRHGVSGRLRAGCSGRYVGMAERAAYMNEGATKVVEAGALCKVPALAVTTCRGSGAALVG